MFFHGNAQSIASAWPLLSNLPEAEFGIAAVEYIGYGPAPTTQRITERRILTGCRAALDVIAEQPEVNSLILLGYSMGSFFATAMAAEGWGEWLVLAAPLTSAADIARREAPRVPPSLLLGSLTLDTMSRAPGVSLPTLILHSDADELFPLSMGHALAGAMPQARLVRLGGATHAGIGGWLAPAVRATSAPFVTWPTSEAELARHR